MTESLLTVANVSASYGKVTALQGVSLEVNEGETVGIVGSNGAGKTTLLRAVAGVLSGSSLQVKGTLRFNGHRLTGPPWSRADRGIAMIPSTVKVFGQLTVKEHLQMASRRGKSDFVEAFDVFPGLQERLDAPASMLSGGERQMLALTAALLRRPKLILIDELSQGLSPAAVGTIVKVLQGLHDVGLSLVVVEQSLATAISLADRCYAMDVGRVVDSGPANRFADLDDARESYLGKSERTSSVVVKTPKDESQRTGAEDSTVLSVANVHVEFRGIRALRELSFTVPDGQCLGLVGPNGAGKSTLLNCINGIVRPSTGSIVIFGTKINKMSANGVAELGVARTFQSAEIWREMTVSEVVAVGTHVLHLSRRATIAATNEALDVVGLNRLKRAKVKDLPYGHAKLVDIARALALRPKMLLLDEPASGLSAGERVAMVQLLARVHDELGITQVVVEHDMTLVKDVCERLIVLSHGQMIGDGLPEEVLMDENVARELLGL